MLKKLLKNWNKNDNNNNSTMLTELYLTDKELYSITNKIFGFKNELK